LSRKEFVRRKTERGAVPEKQINMSQETDDFETHQTVGFGTHLTVDGDARLITRPA
jgi:hypothetical protein